MNMMESYIDKMQLGVEYLDEKRWIIHLSNGKTIDVEKEPEYKGSTWAWQVETQVFSDDKYALKYLTKIITEKLTGNRIIPRQKYEVPEICGVEGRACRHPGKCNSALCSDCPVAEKFFADRDGVELIYAV